MSSITYISVADNGRASRPGRRAKVALIARLRGRRLVCTDTGDRSYDRHVMICRFEGRDLAALIVRDGWAFDWPRYSHGRYPAVEKAARAARRGLWRGRCVMPWIWRRCNRR